MYKYLNVEPRGEKLQDCVIRAMNLALDIPYYEIVVMLYENGDFHKCDELCVCCYEKLLEEHLNLTHYYGDGRPVYQVAEDFADNILLIRIDGHLTCSLYGVIYDIWNCENEKCTDFWVCF